MWIIVIFPLTPILIGIVCIALGLFGEIQSNLGAISTFLNVLVIIVFLGIAIYNLTRQITVVKKVVSTIACVVLGTIAGIVLNTFIRALAEIEFGLLGLIEFVFVVIMGGSIALLIVLGCIMACCWFSE